MRFICSHDEHGRCYRLLAVLEFVHRIKCGYGFDIFEDVEALEDYKGNLIVHCAHDCGLTIQEQGWFRTAWAGVGCEPTENVDFKVPDRARKSFVQAS
jgi:hypothetical protein